MIRIQFKDKILDFEDGEVRVIKVDNEGNAKRLDLEPDATDWSDVLSLISAERERAGAAYIYG